MFPILSTWYTDSVVVGAAKAHGTLEDVTASDNLGEKVEESDEKEKKGREGRHCEDSK